MKKDQAREERIRDEIMVDAYGSEEQVLSWYYYLEEKLSFSFRARCIRQLAVSPLEVGEEVGVIGMPAEEDCDHEMFVIIDWQGRKLGVPLSQLETVGASEDAKTAVEDWHYWVAMGYEFG